MKNALTTYLHSCKSYDHSVNLFTHNGVEFKTLWVPFDSGNRTATINLNHAIGDFVGCDILVGYNGNCSTPYAILPIPAQWTEEGEVTDLATALCARLGKTSGYRVLKADARLVEIIREIVRMAGPQWSDAIYGDIDTIDLVTGDEKLERLRPVNQQMVRDVVRMHEGSGIAYVLTGEAKRLAKVLHRYPKGHQFQGQIIGVSISAATLYRGHAERVCFSSFNAPRLRSVERTAIEYYDVGNGDKRMLLMVGDPAKAIAELDRKLAADDARMRDMVEQTFVRGVRVSRPEKPTTIVRTKDEIMTLLSAWGLEWNTPSLKRVDRFLKSPEATCHLFLRNSGPVSTILARL
jgi:hypothetical protein